MDLDIHTPRGTAVVRFCDDDGQPLGGYHTDMAVLDPDGTPVQFVVHDSMVYGEPRQPHPDEDTWNETDPHWYYRPIGPCANQSDQWLHWADSFYGDSETSPDITEAALACPELRGIWKLAGWCVAAEEGLPDLALGLGYGVAGKRLPPMVNTGFMDERSRYHQTIGWFLGRTMLAYCRDGEGEVAAPQKWAFDESPERMIANWRDALAERASAPSAASQSQ